MCNWRTICSFLNLGSVHFNPCFLLNIDIGIVIHFFILILVKLSRKVPSFHVSLTLPLLTLKSFMNHSNYQTREFSRYPLVWVNTVLLTKYNHPCVCNGELFRNTQMLEKAKILKSYIKWLACACNRLILLYILSYF